MAATWSIINLDRQVSMDGKADVITTVHWQVVDLETVGSGDDAMEHHGSRCGSVGLDTSDLSSFIAYADIKESDAITWAKEALGEDQVAACEQSVADQITESKTPTTKTGKPF